MSAGKVLKIAVILGILIAGITFMIGALGATSENVDMSGSDYEGVYDSTTTISIQSISMMYVVMLILAVSIVIIGVKSLAGI